MSSYSKASRFYSFIALFTFIAGLTPFVFNLVIDPYEVHPLIDVNVEKAKISEKSHYPLWKVVHFPAETTDTIILGDSRARSLKDKYWHQLGLTNAYNFAYGGATIYEIYDTFQYVKNNASLKTLVVGIQLRSFDPNHKKGMNRVPEAIRLSSNPFSYYTNWFVSRIGAKLLEKKYQVQAQYLSNLKPQLVSSAHAQPASDPEQHAYVELLDEEICKNCRLPTNIAPTAHSIVVGDSGYYFGDGLGVWRGLWPRIASDRILTGKFKKQVSRNARSDWKKFQFSSDLWAHLVEMSVWCEENDVELIFVIPPTIVEMQQRIVDFGFGELNHDFRLRLASLATVFDFDFDNPLTRDIENFTDAYHFDYRSAKQIIGEVAQHVSDDEEVTRLAKKRRKQIICPLSDEETIQRTTDKSVEVLHGQSCRIWRLSHAK